MFLFLIFLFMVFVLILNILYKSTNHYRNQFVDVCKYWHDNDIPDNLEIVNLGSNHPKFAFDYDNIGVKGMNLAVGPQTLEYDFSILKKVTPHLSPKAVVVIPICLLSFFLYRQKNRNLHYKYYTFLPSSDIIDYSWWEKIKNIDFPLLFHPLYLRFIIRDCDSDNRFDIETNPLKTDNELNRDAQFWLNCWNQEFGINIPSLSISDDNKQCISQNVTILKEMLVYCQKNGFNPVVAILPVTANLYSLFSKEFIEIQLLYHINDANVVDAPVLNYLTDERFSDSSLYINSFFFNKIGRSKFTKEFILKLRSIKYL